MKKTLAPLAAVLGLVALGACSTGEQSEAPPPPSKQAPLTPSKKAPAPTTTTPAPAKTSDAKPPPTEDPNHCNDPAWWNKQAGDPGQYVQACGEWPYWLPEPQDPDAAVPTTPGLSDDWKSDTCASMGGTMSGGECDVSGAVPEGGPELSDEQLARLCAEMGSEVDATTGECDYSQMTP